MKIAAFVPAKGTSSRVPSKNMAILDGEHLFKRKLRQLLRSELITDVYLDTESADIRAAAADLPVKVIDRDDSFATNATDGHELFQHSVNKIGPADFYIQALCTAPFIDHRTVDRAIRALMESPEHDSLIAVRSHKMYEWVNGQPAYGRGRVPNSVDLPDRTLEAMSLYIVRGEAARDERILRFGERPLLFEVTPEEDIDINYPADMELAELICAGYRERMNQRLRALLHNASSPAFADTCKDLGIRAVLPPNIRRITGGPILGRAKTLKLKPVSEGAATSDEWKGIYKALDSYQFVRRGDIIVVSNDVPDKAYFGDLNAMIATRAGAAGAIIDGYTRDVNAVSKLGLSVFARSAYCDDIKYEGTTESMNMPVEIGGVAVRNNDYIFADGDGVVVIPQERWDEVETLVWNMIENEARIRVSVARGLDLNDVLNRYGAF